MRGVHVVPLLARRNVDDPLSRGCAEQDLGASAWTLIADRYEFLRTGTEAMYGSFALWPLSIIRSVKTLEGNELRPVHELIAPCEGAAKRASDPVRDEPGRNRLSLRGNRTYPDLGVLVSTSRISLRTGRREPTDSTSESATASPPGWTSTRASALCTPTWTRPSVLKRAKTRSKYAPAAPSAT